jgi:hypothetical protein
LVEPSKNSNTHFCGTWKKLGEKLGELI